MKANLTILLLMLTTFTFSQTEKVKSAFIYQFTKYIEWSSEMQSGDFVIGVLGDDPIIAELTTIAQAKKVVSQPIVVKKFDAPGDISKCQIVYIPSANSGLFSNVKSKIGKASTLIITDKPGMAQDGAGINFIESEGKVQFELNKNYFSAHSLKLSNQLVNLAKATY